MLVLYYTLDGGLTAEEADTLSTSDDLDQIVEDPENLPEGITAVAATQSGVIALASLAGANTAIEEGAKTGLVDLRPFCYVESDDE